MAEFCGRLGRHYHFLWQNLRISGSEILAASGRTERREGYYPSKRQRDTQPEGVWVMKRGGSLFGAVHPKAGSLFHAVFQPGPSGDLWAGGSVGRHGAIEVPGTKKEQARHASASDFLHRVSPARQHSRCPVSLGRPGYLACWDRALPAGAEPAQKGALPRVPTGRRPTYRRLEVGRRPAGSSASRP